MKRWRRRWPGPGSTASSISARRRACAIRSTIRGAYVPANLAGHLNMLELARQRRASAHLVYASSSSVYGGNKTLPFRVEDRSITRSRSMPPPSRRTS